MDEKIIIEQIIPQKLREIEAKENVRILHCVESGSRAWGFPSPDSDFDVRFIYVRPMEYYLRLDDTRDVIQWQLDETLDISGWDLSKALTLLHKSNPTIFEWNSSPIVYKTTPEWKEISDIVSNYFQQKNGLYHYLSMAEGNYREYLRGELVWLKKYFYVLRPILACRWIIEKKSPPPMRFSDLVDASLEPSIIPAVSELLRIKTQTPEMKAGKRVDIINDYIDKSIDEIKGIIVDYPRDCKIGWEELNRIFLKIVK